MTDTAPTPDAPPVVDPTPPEIPVDPTTPLESLPTDTPDPGAGPTEVADETPVDPTPAPAEVPASEEPAAQPGPTDTAVIGHVIPTGLFSDTREKEAFEQTGQRGLVPVGTTHPFREALDAIDSAVTALDAWVGQLKDHVAQARTKI